GILPVKINGCRLAVDLPATGGVERRVVQPVVGRTAGEQRLVVEEVRLLQPRHADLRMAPECLVERSRAALLRTGNEKADPEIHECRRVPCRSPRDGSIAPRGRTGFV